MKEFYKKFKSLTGFSYQDIADKVGASRQYIHKLMDNHSMLYRTSMATVINYCIDDKINELEKHISSLKELQKEITLRAVKNSDDIEEDGYE